MKRLWAAISSNWGLKLLSLLFALSLWIYVVSVEAPQLERVLTVPLKYENLGSGVALAQAPSSVSVRLQAPVRLDVNPESLNAVVNLDGLQEGNWALPVDLKPPTGVTLMEIRPDTVSVQIENIETKIVRVEVVYLGQLPQGFTLGPSATLDPPEVQISAPRSLLSQVQRALAPVDLTDARSQISQSTIVQVMDNRGQALKDLLVKPATVNVSVTVNLASLFKTVPIVPAVRGSLATGFLVEQIVLDPTVKTLEGTVTLLDRISYLTTLPIFLDGQSETFSATVNLDLNGVEAKILDPSQVQATVKVAAEAGAEFEVPISAPEALEGTAINPDTLLVKVSGPDSLVSATKAEQITATVRVSDLPAGNYVLPVQVYVPAGLFLAQVSTPTVEVRIGP